MSFRVVIELAGPPIGKARPRNNPHSTFPYIDPRARKHDAQLQLAATQAMDGRAPVTGPVRLTVEQRFPLIKSLTKKQRAGMLAGEIWPTKKPDADNILKLSDCLNQVVFVDDAQVVEATVRKIYSDRPGLTIVVETIEPLAVLMAAWSTASTSEVPNPAVFNGVVA